MNSTDEHQYIYHAANKVEMCQLAEKAKHLNLSVTLYGGNGSDGHNNDVVGIEYAGTNAKFTYSKHAI